MDMVFGAGKSGACRECKWRERAVGRREHGRDGRKGELGIGGSVEGELRAPGRRRRGKTQRVEKASSGGI